MWSWEFVYAEDVLGCLLKERKFWFSAHLLTFLKFNNYIFNGLVSSHRKSIMFTLGKEVISSNKMPHGDISDSSSAWHALHYIWTKWMLKIWWPECINLHQESDFYCDAVAFKVLWRHASVWSALPLLNCFNAYVFMFCLVAYCTRQLPDRLWSFLFWDEEKWPIMSSTDVV